MTGADLVPPAPIVQLRDISKRFGVIEALRGVTLDLYGGQSIGLIGPNGAGKSTLLRCLAGGITPDSGEMRVREKPFRPTSIPQARGSGVRLVQQELDLFPNLSVRDNWALLNSAPNNHEPPARVPLQFNNTVNASSLEAREAQQLCLSAALESSAQILLLDEPTATLDDESARETLERVRRKLTPSTVVVISTHRITDLQAMDRWIFLAAGTICHDTQSLTEALSRLLATEVAGGLTPGVHPTPSVQIQSLTLDSVIAYPNMVLGITSSSAPSLYRSARALLESARHRSLPVAFLGPERRQDHVLPDLTVSEHAELAWHGQSHQEPEKRRFVRMLENLDIEWNASFRARTVQSLSGGTQQKLFLSLAMCAPANLRILCDPTRGIDQRSCQVIAHEILHAREQGRPTLIFSQDLEQLNRMTQYIGSIEPHKPIRWAAAADPSLHH